MDRQTNASNYITSTEGAEVTRELHSQSADLSQARGSINFKMALE